MSDSVPEWMEVEVRYAREESGCVPLDGTPNECGCSQRIIRWLADRLEKVTQEREEAVAAERRVCAEIAADHRDMAIASAILARAAPPAPVHAPATDPAPLESTSDDEA